MKIRQELATLAAAVLSAAAFTSHAQVAQPPAASPALEAAQARYAREVAACNNANLPAPQREGCVRAAGVELDRVRLQSAAPAGPPRVTPLPEATTQDGRATVIRQSGTALQPEPPAAMPAETRTTQDGRATIVVPSDSTLVRPAP